MPVNLDKPQQWKDDIAKSVDMYNDWFMRFAPKAFRETRVQTTEDVESALLATKNLTNIQPATLRKHPEILPTLRMSTCPPIAVDRLIGLAGVTPNLVKAMEQNNMLPPRMPQAKADKELERIAAIIGKMADPDIFVWLGRGKDQSATPDETHRAATIVADRLCGAVANPIIRNAQEKRQLAAIKDWLTAHGYKPLSSSDSPKFDAMPPGTFCIDSSVDTRMNALFSQEGKWASLLVSVPSLAHSFPAQFDSLNDVLKLSQQIRVTL